MYEPKNELKIGCPFEVNVLLIAVLRADGITRFVRTVT